MKRNIGEVIRIGSDIRIMVLGQARGGVSIGIEAPDDMPVHRQEVYEAIERETADEAEQQRLKRVELLGKDEPRW